MNQLTGVWTGGSDGLGHFVSQRAPHESHAAPVREPRHRVEVVARGSKQEDPFLPALGLAWSSRQQEAQCNLVPQFIYGGARHQGHPTGAFLAGTGQRFGS